MISSIVSVVFYKVHKKCRNDENLVFTNKKVRTVKKILVETKLVRRQRPTAAESASKPHNGYVVICCCKAYHKILNEKMLAGGAAYVCGVQKTN